MGIKEDYINSGQDAYENKCGFQATLIIMASCLLKMKRGIKKPITTEGKTPY